MGLWSGYGTKRTKAQRGKFGISDVGLKKVCQRHRVPTPPRDYWARQEAGKQVTQIRFHETADPQEERILIHGARNDLAPAIRQLLDEERERRRAKSKIAVGLNRSRV